MAIKIGVALQKMLRPQEYHWTQWCGNPHKTAVLYSTTSRKENSMKRTRYTDSQIMVILKQAEVGTPIPELYVSMTWVPPRFISGVLNTAV